MEPVPHARPIHTRRNGPHDISAGGRPSHSRNNHWVAGDSGQRTTSVNSSYHSDGERWERGGHRGGRGVRGASRGGPRGGRGMFSNVSLRVNGASRQGSVTSDNHQENAMESNESLEAPEQEEPVLETQEERDKFYQELVKARELERKKAIVEGKMDDPSVPKRLEDAISIVGTCLDMCPRFERYRRERENNLFEWETIPGTKRVDHSRAVKMYERAAGDKTLPSDLRPPHVLKRTLDYLFHDLLPRGGFSRTFDFIRDRSRAVRNDFTMQHSHGAEAIDCHDRCARFHILALHFERDRPSFSIPLEEQQLMNTLQSIKEFYEEQRGHYESSTELEMRVYHRLIHIRDQRERHEDIPKYITSHPVFQLTTDFRLHVQRKSAPISKTSDLIVDAEGMQIFGKLANVLREQGSVVMIYLVACILERLFGKDAIDDIEAIRGDLSISDIIDGVSSIEGVVEGHEDSAGYMEDVVVAEVEQGPFQGIAPGPASFKPDVTQWPTSNFSSQPAASAFGPSMTSTSLPKPASAFSALSASPNVFGTPSPFGTFSTSTSSSGTNAPVFGIKGRSVPPSLPSSSSTPTSLANGVGQGIHSDLVAPTSTPSLTTLPSSTDQLTMGSSYMFSITMSEAPSLSNASPPQETVVVDTATPCGAPTNNTKLNRDAAVSKTSVLSPDAAIFTPKSTQSPSIPPFEQPFERSANPSPSHIPPNSKAPPTPAPPPSSSKKPSSPISLHSATPPLLPKIITDIQSPQPESPFTPPLLPKQQPISLPSTPTTHIHPPSAISSFLKRTESVVSNSNNEILSPLYLPSPTTSQETFVHNFSANGTPKSALKKVFSSAFGKGKTPLRPSVDDTVLDELAVKSLAFARKCLLVKECFERWQRRTTDHAAWVEACRQSDAYRAKIQGQRHLRTPQFEKKRRISPSPVSATAPQSQPQKKRARKRVSDYHPPRTDEELARRFKQNYEEHERRWAHGTFLQVIRTHAKTRFSGGALPLTWRIWLSMNPESDATAIWLERKFDVPESGRWASEAVFSIPVVSTRLTDPSDSPGLVVFECTPLEGVADDLERKYRILDDCSRLRDIVKSFPPKRHFLPSLLFLSWVEAEQAKSPSDLIEMIDKLVAESLIQSYDVLSITSATKDLDGKLGKALASLSLDLDGKLVRSLTIRGVYKLFEPSFTSFMSEWIENCSTNGRFDWGLFGQVIEVGIEILNEIVRLGLGLITLDGQDIYPQFGNEGTLDSDSVYDRVTSWLSSMGIVGVDDIARDLQSHRDIGQDFPTRLFVEHLWELTLSQSEIKVNSTSQTKFHIFTADITSCLETYNAVFEPRRLRLGQALNMSIRRSPRRRSISEETDLTSPQLSKRRRLSSPIDSSAEGTATFSPYLNGRDTPSPSNTTVSLAPSDRPVVTIAMLRALTRDMKKRYSGSG